MVSLRTRWASRRPRTDSLTAAPRGQGGIRAVSACCAETLLAGAGECGVAQSMRTDSHAVRSRLSCSVNDRSGRARELKGCTHRMQMVLQSARSAFNDQARAFRLLHICVLSHGEERRAGCRVRGERVSKPGCTLPARAGRKRHSRQGHHRNFISRPSNVTLCGR